MNKIYLMLYLKKQKKSAINELVIMRYYLTVAGALNFFISSVNTLCNKTIEDTLMTVKQYEAARYMYFFKSMKA